MDRVRVSPLVAAFLVVAGVALVVAGVALWSVPAALIVAGLGCVGVGLLVDLGR